MHNYLVEVPVHNYLVEVPVYNYLVEVPVHNHLVELPEECMLVAPDVGEGKPAHVRETRNLRTLIFRVVPPDESNKHLHYVDVFVFTRVVTCDWQVKV